MTADAPDTALAPLLVERSERIAQDIQLIVLRQPDGAEMAPFTPGAHVSVRTPDGQVRKYSLCNAPDARDAYHIAVKREAAGRGGSASMVDRVAAGDTLMVSAPHNDFPLVPSPAGYILIAGGIGITPLLSMAHHLKATGARFKLYYLTRSQASAAFHAEMSGPAFRGLVTLHHDGGDPDRAFDLWPVLEKPRGHVYCCGPRPLMNAVRDMTGHWSSAAVHFEAFQEASAATASDVAFKVRIKGRGQAIDVPIGTTILEALRTAGHAIAFSCESGTCGSCKTRVVSGDVDHRDLVLADHEKADHIMVCVSRARSGDLEIEL